MSTRNVNYIHKKGVATPTGEYVCKLYRHRDGYVNGGLGDELVDAFKKYMEENGCSVHARDFFSIIGNIGGYEFTERMHGDAEYVYHIYDKNDNGRICITYQKWFDEEEILKAPEEVLLDMQGDEAKLMEKQCKELLKKVASWHPEKLKQVSDLMENILTYNQ